MAAVQRSAAKNGQVREIIAIKVEWFGAET